MRRGPHVTREGPARAVWDTPPPPRAAAVGWSGLGDRPASSQAWGLVCPGESPSALGLCPLYVGWGWLYQVASQSVPGLWTVAGPGGEAMETSLTSVLLSREAVTLGRVCPGCRNCCPSTRSPSHTADGSWAVCTVVLRVKWPPLPPGPWLCGACIPPGDLDHPFPSSTSLGGSKLCDFQF